MLHLLHPVGAVLAEYGSSPQQQPDEFQGLAFEEELIGILAFPIEAVDDLAVEDILDVWPCVQFVGIGDAVVDGLIGFGIGIDEIVVVLVPVRS